MDRLLLYRLLVCVLIVGVFLFLFFDKQMQLMQLRLEIPMVAKEVRAIQEENRALQYEIDRFENPSHLMELLRKPEFSYLRHPLLKDVWVIPHKEGE